MSDALPGVYLARHGETAWTVSRRHTGLTDLPLTAQGEAEAVRLGERLAGLGFAGVLTSPLQRAVRTSELAGFGSAAVVDPDLREWNYGSYEGLTTADIRTQRPDWHLFRDGCPGGESPDQVGARADRVVRRVRAMGGDVLLFSSGHFLRVFAARWLGLEPGAGMYFLLGTASLSALGYENDSSEPVIRLWNETPHGGSISANTVAYTGTHDNPTTREWYEEMPDDRRRNFWSHPRRSGGDSREAVLALMCLAWSSIAALAIAPLQDVLDLGREARMNVPCPAEGNWRWRCTEQMLSGPAFEWLRELTTISSRSAERYSPETGGMVEAAS